MSGDLYALDFDGVLCDSCGELSISAIMTAKMRWPEPFKAIDSSTVEWIVDHIHKAKPVIEVGYEYVLLARVLLEMRIPSVRTSQVGLCNEYDSNILWFLLRGEVRSDYPTPSKYQLWWLFGPSYMFLGSLCYLWPSRCARFHVAPRYHQTGFFYRSFCCPFP